MVKIAVTSDMHGRLEKAPSFPPADILICAGDLVDNISRNPRADAVLQRFELQKFNEVLGTLKMYKKIVVIAGNHDWALFRDPTARDILTNAIYLQDEAAEIEGLRFYGSPWTPWFYDWAFMFPENDPRNGRAEAMKTWAKIPGNTQVLITHGPPRGHLDLTPRGEMVGCPHLEDRVYKVRPKLHVFGHIHCSYGAMTKDGIIFANAALCDEGINPVHPIQVFEV